MAANLTQILNFKANFHQEFELFSRKKIYANNGGHFKIVRIITRCTRGVRVVFSVTRMRSSNSARINKSDFTTEKIV